MRQLFDSLPHEVRGGHADDIETLSEIVFESVSHGDALLAQGWRKLKVNRVVKRLVGQPYRLWE